MDFLNIDIALEKYEDKIDLVRKYQKFVYLVLYILIGVNVFFSVVTPRWAEWRTKNMILKRYGRTLNIRQAKVLDKINVEQRLKGLQMELSQKETYFFTRDQFNQFSISALPQLAFEYDNKITALTYLKTRKLDKKDGATRIKALANIIKKVDVYPVALTLEGDFFGFINLLQEIERYNKIVKVKNFVIQRTSIKPLKLVTSVDLEAFVLRE
jgi:hypothetical protein